MPLSDLFKRTPKKEPVKEDPFGSPEMQKKRYDAAVEFLGVLQQAFLPPNGSGHAGTTLSVAAWMAGTSLYRSLNYKDNPPPGTVMLSEKVNEAWPQLLNLFVYYCQRSGLELKPDQWITNIPDEHKPQMDILQAQEKFQDQYHAIMKKHGLDDLDGARAGIIVCSIVAQYHCTRTRDIDVNVAGGIVSMGIVTGAKTVPMPLNRQGSKPAPVGDPPNDPVSDLLKSIAQNSIDGSGTRLVLGEGMTPMSEALQHGGRYILVHPEVIRKLEANGIDAFLVYAAALKIELASKIPQIDFVGGNVAELLQRVPGKQEGQLPLHVRQLLWLKENAPKYGYLQNGNSWKLN
ncbi:MAG: hypothetical protein ACM3PS_10315 [Syntrophothermus sp.]